MKRRRGRPRQSGRSRLGWWALGSLGGILLFSAGLHVGLDLRQPPPPPERLPPALGAPGPGPEAVPSPEAEVAESREAPAGPYVSIVVDDLGRSVRVVEELDALGVPLSYAVLPFESRTAEVAERLRASGAEILCHLPMEAEGGENPGPGALLVDMSSQHLEESTRRALAAVPGAIGVNNHMGSTFSSQRRLMRVVLQIVADEGLFYLDSRTSARSVGYALALELGVPAAERQVFLDGVPTPTAVREQFRRLLELAEARGSAIAIGHPYEVTVEVLSTEVPRARALGFQFVPVSVVLDRQGLPGE